MAHLHHAALANTPLACNVFTMPVLSATSLTVNGAPRSFDPTPAQAAAVIAAFADPHRSLADIAAEHDTSIEQLSLWQALPHVQASLDAIEAFAARRIRMQSAQVLPLAIATLEEALRSFQHEESRVLLQTSALNQLELRRRARETAGRTASLLFRLANYGRAPRTAPRQPSAPQPTPQPPQAPAQPSNPSPIARASTPPAPGPSTRHTNGDSNAAPHTWRAAQSSSEPQQGQTSRTLAARAPPLTPA